MSMRRGSNRVPEAIAEVNLTPMVDLTVTLVVVFLVLMPMVMTNLIPVAAGAGEGSTSDVEARQLPPLFLELGAGKVRIGTKAFRRMESIVPFLRDAYRRAPGRKIVLRIAPEVRHERVVLLLDLIRRSGEWKVKLVTLGGRK